MKCPLKPVGERLIAVRPKAEEKMANGLYLPNSAQSQKDYLEVVACSDAIENIVGAKIIADKYAGRPTTIDDQEYIIIENKEVMAILREE